MNQKNEKDKNQINHTTTEKTNKDIQNDNDKLPKQNITTRKKQKQNNNQEFTMQKEPPEFNDNNFPEIQNAVTTKTNSNQNTQNNTDNITVIPETPMEQQNEYEDNIEFLSPSVVTKKNTNDATPTPIDTPTPITNDIDE